MKPETNTSAGVQQLIDRLQREGLAKAQVEAEAVLEDARRTATDMIEQARQEAEQIVAAARDEAERTRRNGEEAVRLAGRDAILRLTEELQRGFERKLGQLVDRQLSDHDFLRQLLLAVAGRAVPNDADRHLKVLLSGEMLDASDREVHGDPTAADELNQYVRSLMGESLREGMTLGIAGDLAPGVRVQVVEDDLEIELTNETLTDLMLKHLSPRFRALIDRP
jgi:V/A-type H+-transporting ATPase subunit E